MKARVTNIQRMCFNDGPGIRTTIFFKGCSLKCPWCCNPENISKNNDIYGYDIDINDLYNIVIKDKNYYLDSNGGITLSGGEALLQIENIIPLLDKLKINNINICVETSLNIPNDSLIKVLKYLDYIYVDIKTLNKELYKSIGGNLKLYYKNLDYLFNSFNVDNIIFRIPLTKDYFFDLESVKNFKELVLKYKPKKIEFLSVHNLGKDKYDKLNMVYNNINKPSEDEINKLFDFCKSNNIDIKILKI